MEMPKPTEAHRRLHAFLGEWEGEEKLSPSPWGPGGTAHGRSICRLDLDGFFVIQDYVEEKDGRTSYRAATTSESKTRSTAARASPPSWKRRTGSSDHRFFMTSSAQP